MASGKNLIIFYELRGKFPDIPDNVLEETMRECGNDLQRCVESLKEERYLFNQEDATQGMKRIQLQAPVGGGGYNSMGPPGSISHSLSMPAIPPSAGGAHGASGRNSPFTAPVAAINEFDLFMQQQHPRPANPDAIPSIKCSTSHRGAGSSGGSPQSASPGELRRQVPVYHFNSPAPLAGRPSTPAGGASAGYNTYRIKAPGGGGGFCTEISDWTRPTGRHQSPDPPPHPQHQRTEATIFIKNSPRNGPGLHNENPSHPTPPPRPHAMRLNPLVMPSREAMDRPYPTTSPHMGGTPVSPQRTLFVTLTSTCTTDNNQKQVTTYFPERQQYYPSSNGRYPQDSMASMGAYPSHQSYFSPGVEQQYPRQTHSTPYRGGIGSRSSSGDSEHGSAVMGGHMGLKGPHGGGMVIAQETDVHYPTMSPASSQSSLSSEASMHGQPRQRSGSTQEEREYIEALLHHQRMRLAKIEEDLREKKQVMDKLRNEVHTIEKNMFEGRSARRSSFPKGFVPVSYCRGQHLVLVKAEDVYHMKEKNKRLQMDIQEVMNAIDMMKHGEMNPVDPLEQQNFYKNMPTGPRNSIFTKRPDQPSTAPPPLPPRQSNNTIPAPPPQPPSSSGDSEEGEQWSCSACTLLNHPALNKCECCEMPRVSLGP